AEIDAAGEEGSERSELLGDHQWRMIGQHDAAGADTDAFGGSGNMTDDNRGRSTCNPRHAVMFGKPEALVATVFGLDRHLAGLVQSVAYGPSFGNRRKIEYGKWYHGEVLGERGYVSPCRYPAPG